VPPFVTILGRPNHAAITPAFSELEHPSHSQRFLALRLAYAHAEQKSPDRGGDDCDLFKYPTVFATLPISDAAPDSGAIRPFQQHGKDQHLGGTGSKDLIPAARANKTLHDVYGGDRARCVCCHIRSLPYKETIDRA